MAQARRKSSVEITTRMEGTGDKFKYNCSQKEGLLNSTLKLLTDKFRYA